MTSRTVSSFLLPAPKFVRRHPLPSQSIHSIGRSFLSRDLALSLDEFRRLQTLLLRPLLQHRGCVT